jgi:hypothetical protein
MVVDDFVVLQGNPTDAVRQSEDNLENSTGKSCAQCFSSRSALARD